MAPQDYDLTGRMSAFLDPHMVVALLVDLQQKGVYPESEIKPVLVRLVDEQTQLISTLTDLTGENSDERLRKQTDIEEALQKVMGGLFSQVEAGDVQSIANCQSMAELASQGHSKEKVEALYQWTLETYKSGQYKKMIPGLTLYQTILTKVLEPEQKQLGAAVDPAAAQQMFERTLNVKWGLLAAQIMAEDWADAASSAVQLDMFLDEFVSDRQGLTKKEILNQRTSLMHWILWILFKSPESKVVDLFMSEKYLALMSLRCPWMLRYAAGVFLMNKKLKPMTKDLVHVLNQDKTMYADALTDFMLSLHQDMDFDVAKAKLEEAQAMMKADYFLSGNIEPIVSNSRLAIFSIYCRIHESVDISTIAEKMGMAPESAEDWIVDLIQSGKLSGARIDSNGDQKSVFFPKEDTEVYSQVMEKTKNMSFRLFLLQANAGTLVDKKKTSQVTGLSSTIAKHLL